MCAPQRRLFWITLSGMLLTSLLLDARLTREEWAVSQSVDRIIKDRLADREVLPLPITDDATFARRVYLDVLGRIPTLDELEAFEKSSSPLKRFELIDSLLEHPGYVSHQFNYWADLLRLQTRTRQSGAGEAYATWVKDAIRTRMPYDAFVRSLLTAEGYPWDNPAVGYTLRDANMPLDNLSNTVQVFLGTQIVCAQCHDHPFDSWTQAEYYEMAAFTYGLHSRIVPNDLPKLAALNDEIKNSTLSRDEKRRVSRAARDLFRPLQDGVVALPRELKMPSDYAYQDLKPGEKVPPYVPYGSLSESPTIENRLQLFAEWLTSPDNPRFAKTFANRQWKNLLGVGLFEPVDDYNPDLPISYPEVLAALETHFIRSNFDIRSLQRVILNTQAYQRQAVTYVPGEPETYLFEGQQLRRMKAEQIWDSVITLAVDHPEEVTRPYDPDTVFALPKGLLALDPYLAAHMSLEAAQKSQELEEQIRELSEAREMARAAGNDPAYREAQGNLRRLTNERRQIPELLTAKYTGIAAEVASGNMSMGMMNPADTSNAFVANLNENAKAERERLQAERRRMDNLRYARASELHSPTPPGHFLRDLGQSDREMIDNFSLEPTIPQILSFLNGSWHNDIWRRQSPLDRGFAKLTDRHDQIHFLFKSILGRPANETELKAVEIEFFEDPVRAARAVSWALLNTRQFIFIQ